MDLDPVLCTKQNIHNRTEAEIEECIASWEPTPCHHPSIDATSFLQSNQIKEVEMEVVEEKILADEEEKDESAEVRVRSKEIYKYSCRIEILHFQYFSRNFVNVILRSICSNLFFHSSNFDYVAFI